MKSTWRILILVFVCVVGSVVLAQRNAEVEPDGQQEETAAPPSEITAKDGAEMVLIPAGEFQMGSNGGDDHEKPVHTVDVDVFYIDKYEVTNAQYRKFVQATGHREPKGYGIVDVDGGLELKDDFEPWKDSKFNGDNQPVVCVSWHDAMAYAQWAGKRLPTEAEWEKAARGGLDGEDYPWGSSRDSSKANHGGTVGNTTPVGKYPPNGYGLYDMAGNAWEWCLDEYDSSFYAKSPKQNPIAGGSISNVIFNFTNVKSNRVLRGGSWYLNPNNLRVADRNNNLPTLTDFNIGFRCAGLGSVSP